MYSIEAELKGIMKSHGFVIAADGIDLTHFTKKAIRNMIASWKDYPKSMNSYPSVLSKKEYDERTTQYVKV